MIHDGASWCNARKEEQARQIKSGLGGHIYNEVKSNGKTKDHDGGVALTLMPC
jgi:hypothetical protein